MKTDLRNRLKIEILICLLSKGPTLELFNFEGSTVILLSFMSTLFEIKNSDHLYVCMYVCMYVCKVYVCM